MITKNSVVKIQSLAVNLESQPVSSNPESESDYQLKVDGKEDILNDLLLPVQTNDS